MNFNGVLKINNYEYNFSYSPIHKVFYLSESPCGEEVQLRNNNGLYEIWKQNGNSFIYYADIEYREINDWIEKNCIGHEVSYEKSNSCNPIFYQYRGIDSFFGICGNAA